MRFLQEPIRYGLLALLVVAALPGCSKPTPQVEDGKQISVVYEAKTPDGEVVDASYDDGPIVFVVGTGKLQPKVEDILIGMKLGDEKTVAVQDAYGAYDESKTGLLPLAALPDGVKAGDEIDMISGLPSRIKEIDEVNAILDLNHPLAGQEITFTVKVVDVRDPNQKDAE